MRLIAKRFVWAMVATVAAGAMMAGPSTAAAQGDEATGKAYRKGSIVYVEAGDYVVEFREAAAWTIRAATFKGDALLTPTGAMQTVLSVRDPETRKAEWLGTGHGGEEVETIELLVDGQAHELTSDLNAQGTTFVMHKVSKLGPYRHTAKVTVSPEGIHEDLQYEVVDDPANVVFMYAFMHCFPNSTSNWIVGLSEGEEQGEFADDNSFTLKKDIQWALVYNPELKIGLAYEYPKMYEGTKDFKNSFWNRPRDNKLYLKITPDVKVGDTFGYEVKLTAYTAEPDAWEAQGRSLIADY